MSPPPATSSADPTTASLPPLPPLTFGAKLTSVVRLLAGWTYLSALAVLFAVACLLALPSRRLRIYLCCLYGHWIGRVMVWFAGASLSPATRAALEPKHPAIYLANHTSYLDNFIGIWAAPLGTLGTAARRETLRVPFFGQLYALSGHVLIGRAEYRSAVSALRDVIAVAQRHRLGVWLFPEGARSPDGRLRPFKRGFAHVALATRLPVVPVVISGAHRCWPKGSPFTRPATVRIQVLDAIPTTGWTLESLDGHVADIHARFAAALPPDQKPLPHLRAWDHPAEST